MKSLENKIRTTLNATNLGGISYQEINFIRHHLNLELSELDKSSWLDVKLHNAPNEHDLIFQSKKETDLITFQGPSKYKVNVNRPDEEWNSLHTLQAYSLLTHELGHFMQSTLSKEISNRSYQLSHLYLAPKFLVEGYPLLQEKFRLGYVSNHKKIVAVQSPTAWRLSAYMEENLEALTVTSQLIDQEYLLGVQIEKFNSSLKSSKLSHMRVKYLEYFLVYTSLLGLRMGISPDKVATTINNRTIIKNLTNSQVRSLNIDIFKEFKDTPLPENYITEAMNVELEMQQYYYNMSELNSLATSAYFISKKLDDQNTTKIPDEIDCVDIQKVNRNLLRQLMQGREINSLTSYTNNLSALLFNLAEKID